MKSRKTTQSWKKEITLKDGAVFLLSLLEEGKAENEKEGKDISLEITEESDNAVICMEACLKAATPFFGPQPYLDAKEGVSYELKIPGEGKLLAIYQHKDWWIRPCFPEKISDIPEKTQLVLGKKEEGYFALLAVCGKTCRSDIRGTDGKIIVSVASNAGNRQRLSDISLVIATGENPYCCIHKAVEKALSFTGRVQMARENRKYPEMFEKFGWCSWDAFYHAVSEDGILEKLQEFKEKEIPVGWVLIDDGWLNADYEKQLLKGFDAAKEKFPSGLASCVRKIKEKYGVNKVGVWHAIMGYWNGLEEKSEAEDKEKDYAYYLPDGRILPAPDAGKAFQFFENWHSYLKNQCGIDFVKVDGQSSVSLAYTGMQTYGEASGAIQKGLNASAALHFENNIINCMGMASEDMWNRPSSAIARSSDDFVPQVSHGFREHALQNSYNSLLQGQFFWGDWDMFWSSHTENRQNSMLRAVSGGPVYVSDAPGKTDGTFIWPLIKKDGTLLRCDQVGVPTTDCLFENPLCSQKGLKIFNRKKDTFLVAVFHLREEGGECKGEIRLSDIGKNEGEYIVYSWTQGKMKRLNQENSVSYCLKENDSELFILFPVSGTHQILGILGKYIPDACVEILLESEEETIVRTEEEGSLGFVADKMPEAVWVNGISSEIRGPESGLYKIENLKNESSIIRILWKNPK